MIELRKVFKKFDHIILDKIDLTLKEGNVYLFKGISGSGKTTLLNLLSFLDTVYDGEYLWNGKNVRDMSEQEIDDIKNNISYVFQKSYLFKKLTVKENLLFICDNLQLIEYYAEKFNVKKILDKKPEEISGGEKQRIALIRALLLNSKIIILDEPTSSLDKNNAEIFADYLREIAIDDKIIIISTHKDIYDDFANQIYRIEEGKLNLIKVKISKKNIHQKNEIRSKNRLSFKYDFQFVKKRKNKRIMFMFIMIIYFLLIFFSISIIQNIKKEMLTVYSDKYPLHVFTIYKDSANKVDQKIIKKYYNYKVENDDFNSYILLDEEDSYFKNKSVLSYGYFPKNENEVLVNEEFVENILSNKNYEDNIGKEIKLKSNIFKIVGIISNDDYPYFSNEIYNDIIDPLSSKVYPAVFIPYSKMEKIGFLNSNDEKIIITISKDDAINLYLNSTTFTNSNNEFSYDLKWINTINNNIFTTYNYFKVGLIIGLIMIVFVFIFMVSKILLELYYRKKEIGFLQLYRVSKKRILSIFMLDYLLDIILSFILSFVIFNIICLIINLYYNLNFFISLIWWSIIIFIVFIYYYLLLYIPISIYLKKDILECINSN